MKNAWASRTFARLVFPVILLAVYPCLAQSAVTIGKGSRLLGFSDKDLAILFVTEGGSVRRLNLSRGQSAVVAQIPEGHRGLVRYTAGSRYVLACTRGSKTFLVLDLTDRRTRTVELPRHSKSLAAIANSVGFNGLHKDSEERSSVVMSLGATPGDEHIFVGCFGRVLVYKLPDLKLADDVAVGHPVITDFYFAPHSRIVRAAGWSVVSRSGAWTIGEGFKGFSSLLFFKPSKAGKIEQARAIDFSQEYAKPIAVSSGVSAVVHGIGDAWKLTLYRAVSSDAAWSIDLQARPTFLYFPPSGRCVVGLSLDGGRHTWRVKDGKEIEPPTRTRNLPAGGPGDYCLSAAVTSCAAIDKHGRLCIVRIGGQ